jgi:hypothetical protein
MSWRQLEFSVTPRSAAPWSAVIGGHVELLSIVELRRRFGG